MRYIHPARPAPTTVTTDPDGWMGSALCTQVDADVFYPGPGGDIRPAKKICGACPVREPCLVYGMDDPHGVYGGLTPNEREKLRRANGRPCPHCGRWFIQLHQHLNAGCTAGRRDTA